MLFGKSSLLIIIPQIVAKRGHRCMSMRTIITLCFILAFQLAFGQKDPSRLSETAFNFYMNKQFDSAAFYYERFIELKGITKDAYYYGQLGECYARLGKLGRARESYLEGLKDTSQMPYLSFQRNCCLGLVDLYLVEKNYEKALEYLKRAERDQPYFRGCSRGEFERNTQLRYKFAQCYEGLSLADTAIAYLTPYMFSDGLFRDSLKYDEINRYYVSLLKDRYQVIEIKKQLSSAIDEVYFSKEREPSIERRIEGSEFYRVNCYLMFFGEHVTLFNGGYEAKSWGGEPVKEFSKEYLIDRFRQTTTYRMISEL
jgi:tetratricopeptide (TPR) repeat protein